MKTVLSDFGHEAAASAGTAALRRRARTAAAALACCVLAAPATGFADAPDAYLDYVESTGIQYVDTGVVGADGLVVEAEMEWTSVPASGWACFLGSAASESVMYCPYQAYDATTHRMAYMNQNPAVQGGVKPLVGVRYRIVVAMDDGAQTNTIRRIDGASMARIYTKSGTLVSDWRELPGPVDTQHPMFVFARNLAGTADRFASARLYSLKIWRRGDEGGYELARHFLPCSNGGAAALYDKRLGEIHRPQGGALVAGPVLPRPERLVAWVQSDGPNGSRGLYVDAGVPARAPVGMVAEMEWRGMATTNFLCGATGTDGKRIWLYYAEPNDGAGNATHKWGYNNWRMQIQGGGNSPSPGVRYRVESVLAPGRQSISVRSLAGAAYAGSREWTDGTAVDAGQSLFVFACNAAGTPSSNICARLYSLSLTNELGLLRDFRPCVADDGRAGLYDAVSERVFFPRAAVEGATAAFDPATEVGAATNLPARARWPSFRPEWIEANGTNDYVDLGVRARDGTRMLADMEWTSLPEDATFCGAATNSHALFTLYRVSEDFHRTGYANGSRTIPGTHRPEARVRYRVAASLGDAAQALSVERFDGGAWVAAGERSTSDAGPMDLGIPLYLFARNLDGVPDGFAAVRLRSFRLWQDGALVRDLVPAFDPADGAPALWDKRSCSIFRNAGGQRFSAGGETTPFPGRAAMMILR